ncbi:MAG: N-acetylmuramoyl-L-alanine amidase [Edaphobacter sp.]
MGFGSHQLLSRRYNRIDLSKTVTRRPTQIIKAATTLALAALFCLPAPAQTAQSLSQTPKHPLMVPFTPQPKPAPPPPARTLILLDPAHGGPDAGANLGSNLLEKDITLAFNNRLRALLSAANVAVISTRTSDPATLFTTDQRAEIANHDRPAVCLILHATGSGSGVHLFTSALTPTTRSAPPTYLLRWNAAQVPSLRKSRLLADAIGTALLQARLPVIFGQASVPPIDNLTCPAIAIELAPLTNDTSNPTPVSDPAYQQRVAQAIATALTDWRTRNLTGADQ